MKKRILSLILCMVLALPMIQTPILAGATEGTEDTNGLYTKTQVSEYRTNGTYPKKAGYVFAGWYEDAAHDTPVTEDIPEDGAYAKYVDEKVLNMKFQFTNGTTTISENTNLRLITSVDSRDYQDVGFVVQVKGYTPSTIICDKVYDTIYGYANEEKISYKAHTAFENDDSKFFATKILMGVAKAAFSREIQVTPFWTTMDGTTVNGTKRTFVFSELFNVYYELDLSEQNTGSLANNTTVEGVTVNLKNSSSTDTVTVCEDAATQEKYIEVTGTSTTSEGIRIGNSKINFSSGVKTIAFELKIDSITDGKEIDLWVKEGTNNYTNVKLGVTNAIRYFDKTANKYVDNTAGIKCVRGEWVSVVLVVNSDKDTFTLYYNGQTVVENQGFRAAQDTGLAEIQIFTASDSQSNFDIRNFVIYDEISGKDEDNVYYELDLSEQNTGAWTNGTCVNNVKISNKNTNVAATVKQEATTNKKYFAVNDTSNTADAGIRIGDRTSASYVIDFSSGVKTISFDLKINSLTSDYVNLWVLDRNTSSTDCIYAITGFNTDGSIQYRSGGAGYAINPNSITWDQGVWVSVKLVVNSDNKTYSMYYDGAEVVKDVAFFATPGTGKVEIQIFGSSSCQSNFAIRDFVIYDEVNGSSIVDDNVFYELDLSGVSTGSFVNNTVVEGVTVCLKNGSSTDKVTVCEDTTTQEKYIEVTGTSTTSEGIRIGNNNIDFSSGVKTIAFELKIDSITDGKEIDLWVKEGTNNYTNVKLGVTNAIRYFDKTANKYVDNTAGIKCVRGEWVSVVLVVNSDKDTFTLYYNGQTVVENQGFRAAQDTGLAEIQIFTASDSQSNFDIRDFVIYKGEISVEN